MTPDRPDHEPDASREARDAPAEVARDPRLEAVWRAITDPIRAERPGEGAARVARVVAAYRVAAERRERLGSLYPMPLRLAALVAPVVGLVLGLAITNRVAPARAASEIEVVVSEALAQEALAQEALAREVVAEEEEREVAGEEVVAEEVVAPEPAALWEGVAPPLLAELYLEDLYLDDLGLDAEPTAAEGEAGEELLR